MQQESKRPAAWPPILFAIIFVAGIYSGALLSRTTGTGSGFNSDRAPVQEVIDLIHSKYVDSISTDTLENIAIKDILSRLDPHSRYIPPVDVAEEEEDLQGNFQGIGIEFHVYKDTVNVINVLKDGPSYKAGLKTGDQFIKIDDSVIAGKKLTNDQIKNRMRGEPGSKINVVVLRDGKLRKYTIKRGTIPLPSLDIAYMIDKHTGFIRLNKFAATTHREFMQSVDSLQAKGMQQLILDLRDNGGGLLSAATDIADDLLNGEKLIVAMKGNNKKEERIECKRPGLFEAGKLVVLIDEGSASASEVLTGALQDWDRATVIGRRSFGKGLVQSQYDLSNGGALRLTTAHYYTPSGRSIQKPYNGSKDQYEDELTKRYEHGEMLNADSNKIKNGKAYKTSKGKTVYGGGGIMPDIFVPYDTSLTSQQVEELFSADGLTNFLYNYYIKNKKEFEGYRSAADFVNRYSVDNAWNALLKAINIDVIKKYSPAEVEADKIYLKALLAKIAWQEEGYYQVINKDDIMIKKALEVINQ